MKLIPRGKGSKEDGLELFIGDKQYALNLQNRSESMEMLFDTVRLIRWTTLLRCNAAKANEKGTLTELCQN